MFTMTRNQTQMHRIRPANLRGRMHARTVKRVYPLVEILDERLLLTVGFDAGTATFTGDGTAHTLLLSESGGDLAYTVDPDTDANSVTIVTAVPISATTRSPSTSATPIRT